MDILEKIQNWTNEFKSKYKCIGIYSAHGEDMEDYEGIMKDLSEDGDSTEDTFFLEFGVWSVEDVAVFIGYLRDQPGVEIVAIDDKYPGFIFTCYNPDRRPEFYDTPEEALSNFGVIGGSEITIRVQKSKFTEFWKSFLYDFCIPGKYVGDSPWFLKQQYE